MRYALICSLALLAFTSGSPEAQAAPVHHRHTLEHQGRTREYWLFVPAGHNKAMPVSLVLALHGGGGNARGFDGSTNNQMSREAIKRGWIVAYPQGIAKGWNDGRKLVSLRDNQRKGVDDVGFLSKLIDRLHVTHGIDTSRVYATGISNGGFMSLRLGIELGAKIAAIAPVTANLQLIHQKKTPTHAMPVLILNGTKDPLVPYKGGQVRVLGKNRGAILSTDATVAWWCRHNRCKPEVERTALPDKDRWDRSRVFVERRAGTAPVVLYRIVGGGHTWPGGIQYLPKLMIGPVCRDIEAGRVIFDFFAKHRRRQPTKPATATPR